MKFKDWLSIPKSRFSLIIAAAGVAGGLAASVASFNSVLELRLEVKKNSEHRIKRQAIEDYERTKTKGRPEAPNANCINGVCSGYIQR